MASQSQSYLDYKADIKAKLLPRLEASISSVQWSVENGPPECKDWCTASLKLYRLQRFIVEAFLADNKDMFEKFAAKYTEMADDMVSQEADLVRKGLIPEGTHVNNCAVSQIFYGWIEGWREMYDTEHFVPEDNDVMYVEYGDPLDCEEVWIGGVLYLKDICSDDVYNPDDYTLVGTLDEMMRDAREVVPEPEEPEWTIGGEVLTIGGVIYFMDDNGDLYDEDGDLQGEPDITMKRMRTWTCDLCHRVDEGGLYGTSLHRFEQWPGLQFCQNCFYLKEESENKVEDWDDSDYEIKVTDVRERVEHGETALLTARRECLNRLRRQTCEEV